MQRMQILMLAVPHACRFPAPRWKHPLNPSKTAPHVFLQYVDEAALVPIAVSWLHKEHFSVEPPKSKRENHDFCLRLDVHDGQEEVSSARTSKRNKYILSMASEEKLESWKQAFSTLSSKQSIVAYICNCKVKVQQEMDPSSAEVASLCVGEVVEVIARQVDRKSGCVRLQFERGWCTFHPGGEDLQCVEEYLDATLTETQLKERLDDVAEVLLEATARHRGWLMMRKTGSGKGKTKAQWQRCWMVLWR